MPPPFTWSDGYEAIVTYQNISQPEYKWRNTYVFHDDHVPVAGDGIIIALIAFAQAMVHTDVNLVQLEVYNWVRGGPSPYPGGLPLLVVPVGAAGTADAAWGYSGSETGVGGEVCLRIDRIPSGPLKHGRLFLRGLIREGDTGAASGGKWTFASGTPLTALKLGDILVSTSLGEYIGLTTADPMYLMEVAYSKKHGTVGPAYPTASWEFIGPTTNKISRKSHR